MSSFSLAVCKEQGKAIKFDDCQPDLFGSIAKTQWFEFSVNYDRIQEVVEHLAKIGIDYDPRRC